MFREIRVICVRIKKTCVQGLATLGGQSLKEILYRTHVNIEDKVSPLEY